MDILSLCWISNSTWAFGYNPPYKHYFLFGNVALNVLHFLAELAYCEEYCWGWGHLFLCLNLIALCVVELTALALIDHNIALGMRDVRKNKPSVR